MRTQDQFRLIRQAMEGCYQFKGVNMIQHGEMVHDWYCDLVGPCDRQWDFGKDQTAAQVAFLIQFAKSPLEMRCYHVYHDCGKPFCRIVDEDGRQHFPNHAQISHDTWRAVGGCEEVDWYILHDMDFHTFKGEDLKFLLNDHRSPSLCLTAWSELHANAQMFGGIESTSFKIKRKFLERNTKDLYERLC